MDLQQAQDLFKQAVEAYKNNDLELAIQLWSQIKKTSDEVKEIYAEAQYNVGVLFKKLNHYKEAEQAYNNVSRSDSAEQYAKAQVNLGALLHDLKRFNEAEQCYKNVSREDAVEQYATAQFNLGVLLNQQQRFEEAENAYKNITRSDSLEQYATAQFNLGVLLKQQQRFEEAEQAYKNVSRSDSAEQYAKAQVNLGALLHDLKRFNEAEQCYKNVSREDSVEQYAKAQNNLGLLLNQQQRFEEAEQAYKNVSRSDSAEQYVKAQNNFGNLLAALKRFDEAEKAYKNVSSADSVEQYARAQFNLGVLLKKLKRYQEAEQAYKNVNREDSGKAYAFAQWNLYWSFGKNKDYLINVEKEHDLEIYAKARFVLGELEENLDAKHEYWQQIPQETEQYKKESYQINVVKSISDLENSNYKNELFEVFQKVGEVLEALFVDNKYEQSIAHYTTLSVAKLLLANKYKSEKLKFKPKSKLRLNTINLMNDPEEGLLINKLLCLDSRVNTQDSAFIACFTLHHDSLNQFRLYGKEDKEEASGLSLVLDKKFFASAHNAARIYEKDTVITQQSDQDKLEQNNLAAMPLYRCIYFDPTSGLIKVAQREEWSFKREFKLEGHHHWYAENKIADDNWKEYFHGKNPQGKKITQGIVDIEASVKKSLKELSQLIQKIDLGKIYPKEKELLAELLLPLRYLMKHMAFKEEQECRIVYVTKMENPLVHYKDSRFYIEYEPLVMEHLEKIYLAPKAKDEKTYMEYLCAHGQVVRQHKVTKESNGRVQVKISQNPFQ